MVRVVDFSFESATGEGTVQAKLYLPEKALRTAEPTATADSAVLFNADSASKITDDLTDKPVDEKPLQLVQIIHGMAEHIRRYDSFCRFLAESGRAVCLHDQAGHGKTAPSEEKLGYFGQEEGWLRLLDDVSETRKQARQLLAEYGYESIASYLLGHSMGSFISRLYCVRENHQLAGAIFSGTAGRNPAVKFGLFLAERSVRKNGPLYKDAFLAKLTGQGFLRRIENPRTAVDWLTRDQEIVKIYDDDPLCGFTFTAAGYADLYRLLQAVSSAKWAKAMPLDLPLYMFAGEEDPVGAYGKGPAQIQAWLTEAGCQSSLKLYPGARHETLNETNRQIVWQDLVNWLEERNNTEEKHDHD